MSIWQTAQDRLVRLSWNKKEDAFVSVGPLFLCESFKPTCSSNSRLDFTVARVTYCFMNHKDRLVQSGRQSIALELVYDHVTDSSTCSSTVLSTEWDQPTDQQQWRTVWSIEKHNVVQNKAITCQHSIHLQIKPDDSTFDSTWACLVQLDLL